MCACNHSPIPNVKCILTMQGIMGFKRPSPALWRTSSLQTSLSTLHTIETPAPPLTTPPQYPLLSALTSVVINSFERLGLSYLRGITGNLLDHLQFAVYIVIYMYIFFTYFITPSCTLLTCLPSYSVLFCVLPK